MPNMERRRDFALKPREDGAALLEYALLATGIATVVVVASDLFGQRLLELFDSFL